MKKVSGRVRAFIWKERPTSIDLIPTGCSLIPNTQAPSHGAGQTRPVNSGKLGIKSDIGRRETGGEGGTFDVLVGHQKPVKRILPLSFENLIFERDLVHHRRPGSSEILTRSFHLGIMFPMGQPVEKCVSLRWERNKNQSRKRTRILKTREAISIL